MKRRGKSVDLSSALSGLVARMDRKSGGAFTSAKVGAAWASVAGEMVMRHTTGAHLREGTLVIYVDGPVWATELSAMSERYKDSMNQELGQNLVSEVRFTVSRKVSHEHRIAAFEQQADDFYSEDKVDSIPLTETERAQVEASAAEIPGDELREAVVRATVKDLEWKKGIAERKSREGRPQGF